MRLLKNGDAFKMWKLESRKTQDHFFASSHFVGVYLQNSEDVSAQFSLTKLTACIAIWKETSSWKAYKFL